MLQRIFQKTKPEQDKYTFIDPSPGEGEDLSHKETTIHCLTRQNGMSRRLESRPGAPQIACIGDENQYAKLGDWRLSHFEEDRMLAQKNAWEDGQNRLFLFFKRLGGLF